jgi:hypothetical protein
VHTTSALAQETTVKSLLPLRLFILPALMTVIVGTAMLQLMRILGAHN